MEVVFGKVVLVVFYAFQLGMTLKLAYLCYELIWIEILVPIFKASSKK
jgi:hypothetical protein